MRKRISALMALCLMVVGLVVSAPAPAANATVSWPIEITDNSINGVNAGKNGQVTLMSCRSISPQHTTRKGLLLESATGTIRSGLGSYQSTNQFCDRKNETNVDGTFYTYSATGAASSFLYAWKNDRQLWSVDTTSSTNCNLYSGTDKNMRPTSMSTGADGNLYVITSGSFGALACVDHLLVINPTTGAVIHDISLSAGPSGGIYFDGSQAWTYDDYILVVNRDGTLFKYNYDGTLSSDSNYPYTFAPGTGRFAYLFAANADGTVYAATANTSWAAMSLMYHKDDGTTNNIVNTVNGGAGATQYGFTGDGDFLLFRGNSMDAFDTSTNTVAAKSPAYSSGYTYRGIVDYVEDQDGNSLVVWNYLDSAQTSTKVEVLYIEASTGTPTVLFSKAGSGNTRPSPLILNMDRAIADDTLYLSLCEDQSTGCGWSDDPADSLIYKVDLSGSGFGTPVKHTYGQNGYVDDRLEYVAMGDSFSSGEGVEPFLYGTATDTVNECHRSQDAYPMLLEEDEDLNLDMTAFVACSSATTQNVLYGGTGTGSWDSPAQISALSESTDIVTITVGGNDVGFRDYVIGCFATCGPVTNPVVYGAIIDSINAPAFESNLITTYEEILEQAENAEVYVISYPYLTGLLAGSCDGFDFTGARTVQETLNTVIYNAVSAVDDEHLHFVNSNYETSPFEGRELCSLSGSYFNAFPLFGPNWEYAFHPDQNGQEAFKIITKGEIE
ncbi:MAG: SGNH/GDSL hydrolase family protein [Candidatus Microsaccharimonas sp.]